MLETVTAPGEPLHVQVFLHTHAPESARQSQPAQLAEGMDCVDPV